MRVLVGITLNAKHFPGEYGNKFLVPMVEQVFRDQLARD